MVHVQKPDFVFRRNGRSPFKSAGASVQSITGGRIVRISGSNAGNTKFRGSVKGTGYPLHSPVSPSLPLPCVTVCHHVSTALYHVGTRQENITTTDERRRRMATSPLQLPAVWVVRISVSSITATDRIQQTQQLLLGARLFMSQQFPNQQYDTFC